MSKNIFISGMGEIENKFISEADPDETSLQKKHNTQRFSTTLITVIIGVLILSITAIAAIAIPNIPQDVVESLEIEKDVAFEEKFTVEKDSGANTNSLSYSIISATDGKIDMYNYNSKNPDANKEMRGSGLFYEGYLPLIFVEFTSKNGETSYMVGFDATLAEYGAAVKVTETESGCSIEFTDIKDTLDFYVELAAETITQDKSVILENGYDYVKFYSELTAQMHKQFFAALFERCGVKYL